MDTSEEAQKKLESETTGDLYDIDEKKKKKMVEREITEEDTERNPDLPDPRLFSPIQEPDRPSSHERSSEEKED
jgi:hypothetical protein